MKRELPHIRPTGLVKDFFNEIFGAYIRFALGKVLHNTAIVKIGGGIPLLYYMQVEAENIVAAQQPISQRF